MCAEFKTRSVATPLADRHLETGSCIEFGGELRGLLWDLGLTGETLEMHPATPLPPDVHTLGFAVTVR